MLLIATVAQLEAQAVKRPAITGVAFARFYTTDPHGAQKFYGDTLGYKRLDSPFVGKHPGLKKTNKKKGFSESA